MARRSSVNVGFLHDIEWNRYTVHTGIWKSPVRGRCPVGRRNIEGDGHFVHGQSGENFTSEGLSDKAVGVATNIGSEVRYSRWPSRAFNSHL
jgi:hypothetical protein